MVKYLIVYAFVFLAGFIDSVAGGGGLISLPGYILAGFSTRIGIGTTKLSGFPGTIVATVRFAKEGYVRFVLAIYWSACAFFGGILGAKISLSLDENIIKKLMFVILPIVAFFILKDKKTDEIEKAEPSKIRLYLVGGLCSTLLGMYNGLYGPGTGTFFILAYSSLVGLSVKESAGISKFVNIFADISALLMFSFGGTVNYMLGITAALFGMLGGYLGSGVVLKNGSKIVKPIILLVLLLLFVKMTSELYF